METAVTQKGQVTIPKRVRDAMGLTVGARVRIESDGQGGARIVRVGEPDNPFSKLRGISRDPDGLSTDEIMRQIRGEPDW